MDKEDVGKVIEEDLDIDLDRNEWEFIMNENQIENFNETENFKENHEATENNDIIKTVGQELKDENIHHHTIIEEEFVKDDKDEDCRAEMKIEMEGEKEGEGEGKEVQDKLEVGEGKEDYENPSLVPVNIIEEGTFPAVLSSDNSSVSEVEASPVVSPTTSFIVATNEDNENDNGNDQSNGDGDGDEEDVMMNTYSCSQIEPELGPEELIIEFQETCTQYTINAIRISPDSVSPIPWPTTEEGLHLTSQEDHNSIPSPISDENIDQIEPLEDVSPSPELSPVISPELSPEPSPLPSELPNPVLDMTTSSLSSPCEVIEILTSTDSQDPGMQYSQSPPPCSSARNSQCCSYLPCCLVFTIFGGILGYLMFSWLYQFYRAVANT